jgi:hypothetical protein
LIAHPSSAAFEAALPDGRLRLVLPAPQDAGMPVDAVDAALLLARHEPLVQALEPWLQAALMPVPCKQSAARGADSLFWAGGEDGIALGFEWTLLSSIDPGAPPPLALQWQALEFSVEVARFDTAPWPNPAEPATEPGVLLLPLSFASPWRVNLQHTLLASVAAWDGPGSPPALSGAAERRDAHAAVPPWVVTLDERCALIPPQLLGWSTDAAPVLSGHASLQGPQGQRWPGRIAPALGGAGLWL